MGVPLSEDLRVRVIRAVEEGASRREAAARFGVGVATAIRWLKEWRENGRTAALPQGGDRRSERIEAHSAFLLARVEEVPDASLAELREALLRERGLAVAISTLWRFFARRRITLKKRRRMRPSRTART